MNGQERTPIVMVTFRMLAPKKIAMSSSRKKYGRLKYRSVNLINRLSMEPPRYPEIPPIVNPKMRDMAVE